MCLNSNRLNKLIRCHRIYSEMSCHSFQILAQALIKLRPARNIPQQYGETMRL
jgi:hypothetical protein